LLFNTSAAAARCRCNCRQLSVTRSLHCGFCWLGRWIIVAWSAGKTCPIHGTRFCCGYKKLLTVSFFYFCTSIATVDKRQTGSVKKSSKLKIVLNGRIGCFGCRIMETFLKCLQLQIKN